MCCKKIRKRLKSKSLDKREKNVEPSTESVCLTATYGTRPKKSINMRFQEPYTQIEDGTGTAPTFSSVNLFLCWSTYFTYFLGNQEEEWRYAWKARNAASSNSNKNFVWIEGHPTDNDCSKHTNQWGKVVSHASSLSGMKKINIYFVSGIQRICTLPESFPTVIRKKWLDSWRR